MWQKNLKGTPSKDSGWPEMKKMCKYFHLQAMYDSAINIFLQQKYFLTYMKNVSI